MPNFSAEEAGKWEARLLRRNLSFALLISILSFKSFAEPVAVASADPAPAAVAESAPAPFATCLMKRLPVMVQSPGPCYQMPGGTGFVSDFTCMDSVIGLISDVSCGPGKNPADGALGQAGTACASEVTVTLYNQNQGAPGAYTVHSPIYPSVAECNGGRDALFCDPPLIMGYMQRVPITCN